MVGQRPTTDPPNGAELGCSEENETGSGGYPEVIDIAGGDENWARGPNWHTAAVWSQAARVCGPKAHTPDPPAGARIYWRVAPINSNS